MAERDFSSSSLTSTGGEERLNSTKRCLFPKEDDDHLTSNERQGSLMGGFRERSDLSIGKSIESTRHSPISVVSVLDIGCNRKDSSNAKTYADTHPACLDRTGFNPRVEEQTVIEVQYVEPVESNSRLNRYDEVSPEHSSSPGFQNLTSVTNTNIGEARSKPLLDIEKTPSRSEMRRKKSVTPTSILGCGGCRRYLPEQDDDDNQFVERKITHFLEDNSVSTPDDFKTACTDWQAWSYLGLGEHKTRTIEPSPSKENIRTNLRRRTSQSLKTRKSSVRQLKQNIAPFAASPARSPARAPDLFRNRSFSVADHRSAIVRVSRDKGSTRKSCTDMLELCTMYESVDLESPDVVKKYTGSKFEDDELSYGSDPEDFMRRRASSDARSTHSGPLKLKEVQSFGSSQMSPNRSVHDIHNNELFSSIVQEIFNQTTTLVLHPLLDSSVPGSFKSARPLAVEAWLERGQHLTYALVQPKWIWKAKPRLNNSGQAGARQKFCLHGIELLDITKILKVEESEGINRLFAKPTHCFFIKSIHDEKFCFEAKSRRERDRVVSSLKLLIARFGAKVLTGDPEVYYEFFWMNDGAPGQAPDLREAFCGDGDANGMK